MAVLLVKAVQMLGKRMKDRQELKVIRNENMETNLKIIKMEKFVKGVLEQAVHFCNITKEDI